MDNTVDSVGLVATTRASPYFRGLEKRLERNRKSITVGTPRFVLLTTVLMEHFILNLKCLRAFKKFKISNNQGFLDRRKSFRY